MDATPITPKQSKCIWQNQAPSLLINTIYRIYFIVWHLKECVLVFLNPLFSLMKGVAVHVEQSSTSPIKAF